MRETGVEFERRKDQSDGVRPDDAKEKRLCRVQHRLPQSIRLGNSRSDDDSRARTFLAEFADQTRHRGRGRDDDGKIGN